MRLLFFTAPWCAACHAIESQVPRDVVRVDCDLDQERAARHNVAGLPLFVAVDDKDREVARIQSSNVPMVNKWYEEVCRG